MATAGRTNPAPQRGTARDQTLLDAAARLLAEVGYERLTLDAVAARAHASKTTIYRRWPGKAALVAEVLRQADEGTGELPDGGSTRTDLRQAVGRMAASLGGARGPSLISALEAVRAHDDLREGVRERVAAQVDRDAAVISTRAASRGEAADEGSVATVLDLAFGYVGMQTLLLGGPLDDDHLDALVGTLLTLIRR